MAEAEPQEPNPVTILEAGPQKPYPVTILVGGSPDTLVQQVDITWEYLVGNDPTPRLGGRKQYDNKGGTVIGVIGHSQQEIKLSVDISTQFQPDTELGAILRHWSKNLGQGGESIPYNPPQDVTTTVLQFVQNKDVGFTIGDFLRVQWTYSKGENILARRYKILQNADKNSLPGITMRFATGNDDQKPDKLTINIDGRYQLVNVTPFSREITPPVNGSLILLRFHRNGSNPYELIVDGPYA